MSQSELVEIDLGDKVRNFRFNQFDAMHVCERLSQYPGMGTVSPLRILLLLGERHPRVWAEVLAEGFKGEEPNLKGERALRYFQDALQKYGKDVGDIAKQIRKAGELGSVWTKTDDEEEDARGNGSTRSTTSKSTT